MARSNKGLHVFYGPGVGRGRLLYWTFCKRGSDVIARNIARAAAFVPLALSVAAVQAPALAAGDVKAGREKARKCEQCHGLDGQAKIPEAPNLAGQVENYLIEQLREFQSGERHNDMMSVVAPQLTPQDIDDLAAYYSAIPVRIGPVPGQ
jgi:cytochrome c553